LALSAIDKEENRFCLRQKFVEGVLGECDDELFQFALKVGWLNRVGVDAKSKKPVYAFYHPTFQEYFAALAINDWDFFLPLAHDNHNPKPVSERYRIFEPQWKEVILLWLGRPHEEVAKKQKEEFIKALVEFEDGGGEFYRYRAYFLAVVGIAEFRDCILADEIIEQVAIWNLLDKTKTEEFIKIEIPIAEASRTTLQETDHTRAVEVLLRLEHQLSIHDWWDEKHSLQVAEFLGTIAPSNSKITAKVVEVMLQLLYTSQSRHIVGAAIKNLGKFGTGNQSINNTLNNLLSASLDIWVIGDTEVNDIPMYLFNSKADIIELVITTAESLRESGFDIFKAVRVLANFLDFTRDELARYDLARKIFALEPINLVAIKVFRDLVESGIEEHIRLYASGYLELSDADKINLLIELMDSSMDFDFSLELAKILLRVDPDKRKAIDYVNWVIEFLAPHQEEGIRQSAASSLISIDYEPIKREAMKTLIELLSPNYQEDTRLSSCMSLYDIDPDNEDAINTAIELLLDSQEEDSRLRAANFLSFAETKSQKLLPRLVTALKSSLQADCRTDCYEALWRHTQNMTYPDFHKAWHSTHLQLPGAGA
jgi:hypothetical protein